MATIEEPSPFDAQEYLTEDYKLKVEFLTNHLGRAVQRFQFFLTLETALATLLIVTREGELSPYAEWIGVLLIVLSLIWVIVGRSDVRLINIYKEQIKQTWEGVQALTPGSLPSWAADVDSTENELQKSAPLSRLRRVVEKEGAPQVPSGAALAPVILLVFWGGMTLAFFLDLIG